MKNRIALSNNEKNLIRPLVAPPTSQTKSGSHPLTFIGARLERYSGVGIDIMISTFDDFVYLAEDQPSGCSLLFRPAPCYNGEDGPTVPEQRCIWNHLRYGGQIPL